MWGPRHASGSLGCRSRLRQREAPWFWRLELFLAVLSLYCLHSTPCTLYIKLGPGPRPPYKRETERRQVAFGNRSLRCLHVFVRGSEALVPFRPKGSEVVRPAAGWPSPGRTISLPDSCLLAESAVVILRLKKWWVVYHHHRRRRRFRLMLMVYLFHCCCCWRCWCTQFFSFCTFYDNLCVWLYV